MASFIKANFPEGEFYRNCLERDISTVPGNLDIYCAGFPCQPYSTAGKGRGLEDYRDPVFDGCALYIRTHRPKIAILENVEAFTFKKHTRAFHYIMSSLMSIPGYKWKWPVSYTHLRAHET